MGGRAQLPGAQLHARRHAGGRRRIVFASNADPSGVTGLATIARAGYPDPFALRKGHDYYDPKQTTEKPIWFSVEIAFVERFKEVLPLTRLKQVKGLQQMMVNQKGSRLSVQPVTLKEYEIVCRIARQGRR